MPAKVCAIEGSDGGALATPGGGVGSCGVDVRPPSDSENFKTKSPRRISPRGLCYFCDGGVMPVICPTCQSVLNRQRIADNSTKRLRQIATALADCSVN
jgi:hypothetical protein